MKSTYSKASCMTNRVANWLGTLILTSSGMNWWVWRRAALGREQPPIATHALVLMVRGITSDLKVSSCSICYWWHHCGSSLSYLVGSCSYPGYSVQPQSPFHNLWLCIPQPPIFCNALYSWPGQQANHIFHTKYLCPGWTLSQMFCICWKQLGTVFQTQDRTRWATGCGRMGKISPGSKSCDCTRSKSSLAFMRMPPSTQKLYGVCSFYMYSS